MEKPNVGLPIVLNFLLCSFALTVIGLLEWYALRCGQDGLGLSLSIGTIGLIVGVKGKDIKDAITGIFKK